jgi:protein-tyrosine phosphatase
MADADADAAPIRVLFVCLGNICRSPMAEGVFRHLAEEAGQSARVHVESRGTSDYHAGRAPDPRAQRALAKLGIDISALRAEKLKPEDFEDFDVILAMDARNLGDLVERAPAGYPGEIGLFLEEAPELGVREMPDPYFGGEAGFRRTLSLIETASRALLTRLGREKAPQRSEGEPENARKTRKG